MIPLAEREENFAIALLEALRNAHDWDNRVNVVVKVYRQWKANLEET